MTAAKQETLYVECKFCDERRTECHTKCDLRHKEVEGLKDWMKTMDRKLWGLVVGILIILIKLWVK